MVQTNTKRQLTAEDRRIIGQLLMEILAGSVSEDTRNDIYSLGDPLEIPEPYGHLIGYAQGYALDNMSMAHDLREEVRGICIALLEEKWEKPDARSTGWIGMYGLLSEMLADSHYDIRQNIEMLPDPNEVPAWAEPLIQCARSSSTEGKKLTIDLLNILENIIKKRKEQLS